MLKIFKNCKKGFTLLELLVVVLIIGILASIALPQYDKAVTKARLAEVLLNIKAIEQSIDRYLLKNGFPDDYISFRDFGDIELSGGEWDESSESVYNINKYAYDSYCGDGYCCIVTYENSGNSSVGIEMYWVPDGKYKECRTRHTDKGRFICKYLEPLGWGYIDDY